MNQKNHDEIEEFAVQAAKELGSTVNARNPHSEFATAIFKNLRTEGSSTAKLMASIAADESLGYLRGGWISIIGTGMLLQDYVLPSRLIQAALEGDNIQDILKQFREFALSRKSSFERYAPVVGVTVDQVVNLTEDVALIPWADVPEGNHKKRNEFNFEQIHPQIARATSAIRINLPEREVLFSSSKEQPDIKEFEKEMEYVNVATADVLRCATLIAEGPVGIAGPWIHATNPVAEAVAIKAFHLSNTLYDFAFMGVSHNPVLIKPRILQSIFNDFNVHQAKDRDVLRVVLDRINMVFRKRHSVDQAIDLRIALESMMLHDGAKEELRYRIAVRGSTYIGGTEGERRTNFELLKKAYDVGSEAVHTGRFKNPAQSNQILDEAIKLTVLIVRKLIDDKQLPDWEAHVLGKD